MTAQQLREALRPEVPIVPAGLTPGRAYNTVFGIVNHEGGVIPRNGFQDAESNDYVFRELGVTKDITKRIRIQEGLLNPAQYITDKNVDELRIATAAADVFRARFAEYVRLGDTVEEARSRALKAAKEDYNRAMVGHNQRFPRDISKKLAEAYI